MADSSENKPDFVKREEEILAYWKARNVFEESLQKKAPEGEFVFYDGPPFATGLPHAGSLLSSVTKDVIPRYKTMRGYHVRRRWGWDTHGLPIESLVEKQLGLKTKKEILDIGIKKFNETARSMVLQYVSDWKQYVERVGRWVDFDNSYKTMDATYMESVWWALKQIHDSGRLYEGRKVLMYCPHDETVLAKAEIAMDNTYKDITEEAVTVRFKVKNPEEHGLPQNTFILAWTTTPWTLPGNVALAVGPDIAYVLVEENRAKILVAKDLYKGEGTVEKEFTGSDLVGIAYEPLYEIPKVSIHAGKKWEVLPADFVTTGDGTGIVHTAVIYGEDDYALGVKEGLPMVPLLNPDGTYNDDAPEFLRGLYIKKAERDIKADLEKRGLLFKKENYTHSYPHCYRCGTPLIYNAVSSWFVNIQKVKDLMLSENEKITWIPEHLKHGRFKHIVENAPDWTVSRNRFWATPLPIWKNEKGEARVLGSVAELKKLTKKSGNRYFVIRHGEAEHNTKVVISSHATDPYTLTERGKEEILQSAEKLKKEGIQKIITSPLLRGKDTAELARVALGLPENALTIDDRLKEIDLSVLSGQSVGMYFMHAPTYDDRFSWRPEGGENLADVKRRVGELLYELEQSHQDTTFLLATHEYPSWMLQAVVEGLDARGAVLLRGTAPDFPNTGEVVELNFVPLPHNDEYELDLHRPYIDEVSLVDEDGGALMRIPEVVDCWVESATMPFAEYHYPFENKDTFEKRTPGDFIAEYIAQTRTWFYYMHAVSTLLFGHLAFRNVVTTGTVLAADGTKMSKSKGNYTDPLVNVDRFGADAFRFYLMSSVVMQAEDFNFKDEELRDVHNRVTNILRNTVAFYDLYKEQAPEVYTKSEHVLDQWVMARLAETEVVMRESLDRFDTVRATRALRDFVDDLSTWYVRRSRERARGDDAKEQREMLGTLREALRQFSKMIAPVMPFLAEHIFWLTKYSTDPHSVHLADWPIGCGEENQEVLSTMTRARSFVTMALQQRSSAGIRVRQPLAKLSIGHTGAEPAYWSEIKDIVADEVNVKEVVLDPNISGVLLDTQITPVLKEEGDVREIIRYVQGLRKEQGFMPGEKAVLTISGAPTLQQFIEQHAETIKKGAGLSALLTEPARGNESMVADMELGFELKHA